MGKALWIGMPVYKEVSGTKAKHQPRVESYTIQRKEKALNGSDHSIDHDRSRRRLDLD